MRRVAPSTIVREEIGKLLAGGVEKGDQHLVRARRASSASTPAAAYRRYWA
jgi:hypothetical protein